MAISKELTWREQQFADHYIKNGDQIGAYLAAGYMKGKFAAQNAHKLLMRSHVSRYVAEAKRKQLKRLQINADEVLEEIYYVARCDIGEAFDDHGNLRALKEIPEAVRRSISSYTVRDTEFGREVRVTFWDKLKANELLGKHLAMWIERMELRVVDRAAELAAARARVLRLQAEASLPKATDVPAESIPDPSTSDQQSDPPQ